MPKDDKLKPVVDALVDALRNEDPEIAAVLDAEPGIAAAALRDRLRAYPELAAALDTNPEVVTLELRKLAAGIDTALIVNLLTDHLLAGFDELAESLAKYSKPALLDKLNELSKRYGG